MAQISYDEVNLMLKLYDMIDQRLQHQRLAARLARPDEFPDPRHHRARLLGLLERLGVLVPLDEGLAIFAAGRPVIRRQGQHRWSSLEEVVECAC